MNITQKQFSQAKQKLDLELKEEDKYVEKWVDNEGGTLYYRKPDESHMAHGSVANKIKNGFRNSSDDNGKDSSLSLEDLLDMDIDSLEELNELVWDVIGEKVAVEESRSYSLSHAYEGYRRVIMMKGPQKIKVFSTKEASNLSGGMPEPLYESRTDSFEEVLNELDYEVRA